MEDEAKKILVIDDDISVVELLTDTITGFGYKVVRETNALSVIRTIKKEKPDLITLDLRMPKVNGVQIVKVLRREGNEVPILIISGFVGQEEIKQLLELGIKHVLIKPFKTDALHRKLLELLETKTA